MTQQTSNRTINLTVNEFLKADFSTKLLDPVLFLMYETIPKIKEVVDGNDELSGGYGFADIEELNPELYNSIRISLTLGNDNTVSLETYLDNQ